MDKPVNIPVGLCWSDVTHRLIHDQQGGLVQAGFTAFAQGHTLEEIAGTWAAGGLIRTPEAIEEIFAEPLYVKLNLVELAIFNLCQKRLGLPEVEAFTLKRLPKAAAK